MIRRKGIDEISLNAYFVSVQKNQLKSAQAADITDSGIIMTLCLFFAEDMADKQAENSQCYVYGT